jgi:hypothetical protein
VANSIAIVGNGEIGKFPFTYFDINDDFPTALSPTKMTVNSIFFFCYIYFILLLYKWSYRISNPLSSVAASEFSIKLIKNLNLFFINIKIL